MERIAQKIDDLCRGDGYPECYGELFGAGWVDQFNAVLSAVVDTSYCGF